MLKLKLQKWVVNTNIHFYYFTKTNMGGIRMSAMTENVIRQFNFMVITFYVTKVYAAC